MLWTLKGQLKFQPKTSIKKKKTHKPRDINLNTGDFMKKVPTATFALMDRWIVSIGRIYTPSTFNMKSAVASYPEMKKCNLFWLYLSILLFPLDV